MLPSRFEYHRASTVEEALELLDRYGEDAKVLAGGQSLIPLLKLRFAAPEHLIDVNPDRGASRYRRVRWHADDRGAHPPQRADPIRVIGRYPAIAAAAPQIADPLVRNLGTIGGSLAHADPAGDLGAVMLAMGASVVLRSSSGERTVPIDEFLVDTFTTTIAPNELLTEVRVPTPAARSGGTYLKLERKVGDFATVAAAVTLTLDNGSIGRAGIGLTGVGLEERPRDRRRDLAGGRGALRRGVRGGGRLAAAAAQSRHRRAGHRDVQTAHDRGLRATRARPVARDGERGLREERRCRSRSRSTAPSTRSTSSLGCCWCT